jgi:hypothetical protein
MIEMAAWMISVSAVFALAYSLGFQAGRKHGKKEGFERALARAIETQRPLEIIYRTLVPKRAA